MKGVFKLLPEVSNLFYLKSDDLKYHLRLGLDVYIGFMPYGQVPMKVAIMPPETLEFK